jgi:urease accessory protein
VDHVLGLVGLQVAMLEQLIALSVLLFGALLMLSLRQAPAPLGLGLVALSALVHGMAHGAQAPASGFAPYALGFLATTAALHLGGVATGLALRAALADKASRVVVALGSALGLSGLYLMAQV